MTQSHGLRVHSLGSIEDGSPVVKRGAQFDMLNIARPVLYLVYSMSSADASC